MKSIVITGVSRGLGREMAVYFSTNGWRVTGCGRDEGRIRELKREIAPPHRFDVLDVSDDEHVRVWAADVLSGGSAPDLLVNNAAVMRRPAPTWELSATEAGEVIGVNVLGTMNVIRHFVPAMIARKTGVIVNFSSSWGRCTAPEVAAYCASKWAIEGLTSALAQELPDGLAAVALNPGIIATDMLKTCWGDAADAYPSPGGWIRSAGPFIAKLGSKDNGRRLNVPGAVTG